MIQTLRSLTSALLPDDNGSMDGYHSVLANFQLDASEPRTGGTQQFRRRPVQQGTTTPYQGLSTIQSGMVNV